MHKKILIFSLALISFLLFLIPLDDIFFEYISFYLNVIRMFLFVFVAIILSDIIGKKNVKAKVGFRKTLYVSFIVAVAILSFDAIKSFNSFESDRYTSVLTEGNEIEEKYEKYLPFYDAFYEINADNVYYAFASDRSNTLENLYISNRPYELKDDSSSYTASCFKSNSFLMMLKLKFENFISVLKNQYILCDKFIIEDSDRIVVKIYQSSYGYIAYLSADKTYATIEVKHINNVDVNSFSQIIRIQGSLLCLNQSGDGTVC